MHPLSIWAQKYGIAFAADMDAYEQAFLLNCAPEDVASEKAAFRVLGFSPDADGGWTVAVRATNRSGEYYNGETAILCYADPFCTAPAGKDDRAALFFRAALAVDVSALPTGVVARVVSVVDGLYLDGGSEPVAARLTTTQPWYSATVPDDALTPGNEAFSIVNGQMDVQLAPTNVKPGLSYGLGYSETPSGPYVVDMWVEAKPGETVILEAPKSGNAGFYRIVVKE